MPTNVYFTNFLSEPLSAQTQITPALSDDYWSNPTSAANLPKGGGQTEVYWIDREIGITDNQTWVVTSIVTIGNSEVMLQIRLVGTLVSSDIAVQIVAGNKSTGWQSEDTLLTFMAADNHNYNLRASFVSSISDLSGIYDNVIFSVSDRIMPQINHVVVLMMENRSLDNLLGWIYPPGSDPAQVLPPGSSPTYNGLNTSLFNNDPCFNNGAPVYVSSGGTRNWNENGNTISEWCVPNPDPGEEYYHVTTQISNNMGGFLTDYITQQPGPSAAQIMDSYSVNQLPIISKLAKSFAVSDAWYASVPSQTWPNRAFLQAGWSEGRVNNENYMPYTVSTVFNVFADNNLSWMVYNDSQLPSLTQLMFWPNLFKYDDTNFGSILDFTTACASNEKDTRLPTLSFIEPDFGIFDYDESYHPPHDVRPGENFLYNIYSAIKNSPYKDDILFIILFDEHGGTYDHVTPPANAQPPKIEDTSGELFKFDRFGVRIPAIVVSSWVKPGTVFRSNTGVSLDHTSVLATLRDWQGLSADFATKLSSQRIASAPNLSFLLTETSAQSWPDLTAPPSLTMIPKPQENEPINDLQRGFLLAANYYYNTPKHPDGRPHTMENTWQTLPTPRLNNYGDARKFAKELLTSQQSK